MSKSLIFLLKSFLGKFYRNLAIFFRHTASSLHCRLSNPVIQQRFHKEKVYILSGHFHVEFQQTTYSKI